MVMRLSRLLFIVLNDVQIIRYLPAGGVRVPTGHHLDHGHTLADRGLMRLKYYC